MPSKNSIKDYVEGGVYHVYNRGVDKRDVFMDNHDYKTFLFFLKSYLTEPEPDEGDSLKKNYHDKIDLLSYCLMPNHFHLLIKQKGERDIEGFMRSLSTNYSAFFNKKYNRIGPLFQGAYKAILIKDDNYLLHLSRYIHMNPLKGSLPHEGDSLGNKLAEYDWSSYMDYLGKKDTQWVKSKLILDYFEENKGNDLIAKDTYQKFVEK